MIVTEQTLSENLKFIALFVAVFESFKDYVIDCPKQLFSGCAMFREDLIDEIKNQDEKCKKQMDEAKEYLKQCDKTSISQHKLDEIEAIAKYGYIKETNDGFTEWLSPQYSKLICHREIILNDKKVKNKLYNAIMFFVDSGIISQTDFDEFIKIRDIRNKLVHEMASLLVFEIADEWEQLFDKLINLYTRINNHWSVEFELSIGGDDIPTDIEIDYENVITNDLYNLFLSIDVLRNTAFVYGKKYRLFTGLYNCLILPIKMNEENN